MESREYKLELQSKVDYVSSDVLGLKSDLELKYDFSHLRENISSLEYKGLSKKHAYELNANVSYDYDLMSNLKLTPALNVKYNGELNKLYENVYGISDNALVLKNNVILKPNTKLTYSFDKFTASLKLETPFEFSNVKIKTAEEGVYLSSIDEKTLNGSEKFGFNKGSLKATLSLGYKW